MRTLLTLGVAAIAVTVHAQSAEPITSVRRWLKALLGPPDLDDPVG